MRTILPLLFFSLMSFNDAWGQPDEIINAYMYLKNGELDKAKTSADNAVTHERTKNELKAWKYRGDVYYAIWKTKEEKYKGLSDRPLPEAHVSYKKALELDVKETYTSEVATNLKLIQNVMLNEGVQQYNNQDYRNAKASFETAIDVANTLDITDSLLLYNAGLVSEQMEDYPEAIKYYKKCIDIGYRKDDMYSFLFFLYQRQGDTENMKATLDEGLEKYPKSYTLLTSKINLCLRDGKNMEALDLLDRAIEMDPENKVLHFSKGTIEDQLKQSEAAEKSYKNALRLDPNYFDANYNLGALYFNEGVELNNAAIDITDEAAYQKQTDEANKVFKEAMKFLEQAHRVDSNDTTTMKSLKQIYARLDLTEKFQAMNEKLKEQY